MTKHRGTTKSDPKPAKSDTTTPSQEELKPEKGEDTAQPQGGEPPVTQA